MVSSDEKQITQEEMQQLFGETMPWQAVELIWNAPDTMTIGEVRSKLRKMAAQRKNLSPEVEAACHVLEDYDMLEEADQLRALAESQ